MDSTRLRTKVMPKYEHDTSFESFVQELLDGGRLKEEGAAHGIAKKIVTDGVESLSVPQLDTFIKYGLLPDNFVEFCDMCSNEILWPEMYLALDDEYCSYCRHKIEKDD